jgi:hypothetical protein
MILGITLIKKIFRIMAQLTKAAFEALYGSSGTKFPTNTTGAIRAVEVREQGRDIADSFVNKTEYESSATDTFYILEDDFLFNMPDQSGAGAGVTGNWAYGTSGTGSTIAGDTTGMNSTEKCQGVIMLSTGTTTIGFAQIGSYTLTGIVLGIGAKVIATARLALSNLSDATDTFKAMFGITNVITAFGVEPTTGAYFVHDDVSGGNWLCTVKTAGSDTVVDSGIAPTGNENQILKVEVAADSANVKFYIDGTLVATITTDIPTTSYALITFTSIVKSAGTNNRSVYIDYKTLSLSRTSAR